MRAFGQVSESQTSLCKAPPCGKVSLLLGSGSDRLWKTSGGRRGKRVNSDERTIYSGFQGAKCSDVLLGTGPILAMGALAQQQTNESYPREA